MKKIDMHIHSCYSDGTESVENIIKEAKDKGMDLIALTDHNTLNGVDDFKYFMNKYNIKGFMGVELSTMYQNTEIHLLGYFPLSANFQSFFHLHELLKRYKHIKKNQNEKILLKLQKDFDVSIKEFYQYCQSDNINRVHIAKYMIYKNIVSNIDEAFDKYIGETCPYYIEKENMSLFDAIDIIHEVHGLAIIAHLGEYDLNKEILINECIKHHIDGFECYHPDNNDDVINFIMKHDDLILTLGSDYHGKNKVNEIGLCYYGNNRKLYEKISEKTYQRLKRWEESWNWN